MGSNRKIESSPDLLVKYRSLVRDAITRAVRDAIFKHKQAKNPIAIERDGNVVILQPDEIEVD